jgi:sulfatase modifying factor 1
LKKTFLTILLLALLLNCYAQNLSGTVSFAYIDNAILDSRVKNNFNYCGYKEIEKSVSLKPADFSVENDFVLVTAGSFDMGCNLKQRACENDDLPVHRVTLAAYYIGKYEVTIKQFQLFIEKSGYLTDADKKGWSWVPTEDSYEKKNGVNWQCDEYGNKRTEGTENYPVIHVSWNDAIAYCQWFSAVTGKLYRLPTEAEWEFAARGGNKSKGYLYSGSNNIDSVAWYAENSIEKIYPIGKKQPNELGIFDMSGNVEELCVDFYDKEFYSCSPELNPIGPSEGSDRVIRGGSWHFSKKYCCVSFRDAFTPDTFDYSVGFRLVTLP